MGLPYNAPAYASRGAADSASSEATGAGIKLYKTNSSLHAHPPLCIYLSLSLFTSFNTQPLQILSFAQ